MVPVGAKLTDWWPLSPLGVLFHTTRSSSEYWSPWTYGDSDLLTLPTIRFIDLLKTCWLIFGNQPDQFIGWTWPWSLSFLTGSALYRFLYLGLCFSQQSIICHQFHCDTGWSLSLDYNPNFFPSQVRASAIPTIWNWSDHNQTNLFWMVTFSKALISPSLTYWRSFKGFHSRLLKPCLQKHRWLKLA